MPVKCGRWVTGIWQQDVTVDGPERSVTSGSGAFSMAQAVLFLDPFGESSVSGLLIINFIVVQISGEFMSIQHVLLYSFAFSMCSDGFDRRLTRPLELSSDSSMIIRTFSWRSCHWSKLMLITHIHAQNIANVFSGPRTFISYQYCLCFNLRSFDILHYHVRSWPLCWSRLKTIGLNIPRK